jgi:hypothetical protein
MRHIGFLQGADVQTLNDFDNKPGQGVFRQPFDNGRRKQVPRMTVNRMEALHFLASFMGKFALSHSNTIVRQAASIHVPMVRLVMFPADFHEVVLFVIRFRNVFTYKCHDIFSWIVEGLARIKGCFS